MNTEREPFGRTAAGADVDVLTLRNDTGLRARILTHGGTLLSLECPDRHGRSADITLGHDELGPYLRDATPYFGGIIGRTTNRIARGRFALDGVVYPLATNDGPNHLHGGRRGFDKMPWEAETIEATDAVGVALTRASRDGEEGYPGRVEVRVVYRLTRSNELRIDFHAVTDRATPLCLTSHAYWNLQGHGAARHAEGDAPVALRDVLEHVLELRAARFAPVDATLIPVGELREVAATPFDFRVPKPIGRDIDADDEQLRRAGGFDHAFVIDGAPGRLRPAARVVEPASGRVVEMHTTAASVQLYSGNFLTAERGKRGRLYTRRSGFCLEAQELPDSPNQPGFPSVILRPGEEYRQTTVYAFGTCERAEQG